MQGITVTNLHKPYRAGLATAGHCLHPTGHRWLPAGSRLATAWKPGAIAWPSQETWGHCLEPGARASLPVSLRPPVVTPAAPCCPPERRQRASGGLTVHRSTGQPWPLLGHLRQVLPSGPQQGSAGGHGGLLRLALLRMPPHCATHFQPPFQGSIARVGGGLLPAFLPPFFSGSASGGLGAEEGLLASFYICVSDRTDALWGRVYRGKTWRSAAGV